MELPAVEVAGSYADFVFLLEDGTYLHFEFQSTYNEKDLVRFAGYDLRLYERDGRRVITVIIYTANVRQAADGISIGSLVYNPQRVMMGEYDGDTIYRGLAAKIEAGQDILYLAFSSALSSTYESSLMAANELKEKGIFLEPPKVAIWGGKELFVKDPDGNTILIL